ncbi:LysR family transcriptional regulator [Marinobacter sp. M216]|uniref:LysR family transcriptional regulator n=1 Tax=Marinobacter albus TaxID=3030833 RepID=A0ABT7HAF2_9GAMM|nr:MULTISPECIES: LysR family transcriptional regulator [unclassified Marinobacter]MBW7470738.1 LysR family transcriptional regulator [Marinobacter sp. F4218]MDK9556992.1 LysR family transcriptional regulator [Marinobacter sp. M216]
MNFKRLETFIWVATLGSFRKAAERQCTTQPAISTRIAALEEELGVKLFERESGRTMLTTKGQELLPYAEKIVFMSEQLRKRADRVALLSGILRLGVSETIVHSWLPHFFRVLHETVPNLDVEITVDVTGNLRTGLMDRSLDLAFLMGPVSEPRVENRDLCSFPLIWVASPELDLPDRVLKLEELAQWPIITYARNTKPFAEISQKFSELDDLPARFYSSSSLAACRRLALDGIGVSALPMSVISDGLKSGRLVQLEAAWTPSQLEFTASYPAVPFNPVAELAANLAVGISRDYAQQGDHENLSQDVKNHN